MRRLLCLFAAVAMALVSVAGATEYVVRPDGTGDFPTIQAAVDGAVDGDVLLLKKGTFRGEGNRDVRLNGKAITLKGKKNKPESVIINPEGSPDEPHRAFALWDGETLDTVIEGVTITGGYSPAGALFDVGGGISFNGGSATVRNCVFLENDGKFGGGGVSMIFSSPVLVNCVFERNRAIEFGGGAVVLVFSSPTFEGCSFVENWASGTSGAIGAGIAPFWDDPGTLTLIDCHFEGNSCDERSPGAIGFGMGIRLDATRCTFVGNRGGDGGGAIFQGCNTGGTTRTTFLSLADCTFAYNSTAGSGGAIVSNACGESAYINGCTFVGNEASDGGAIWFEDPTAVATIENTIIAFSPNSDAIGGVEGVTVNLSCSDVYGNAGGDYVGVLAGLEGAGGNFSADPLFCDPEELDFTLDADSPCLPEETGCGLVGAWPEGCGDPDDDDDGDRLASPSLDLTVPQLGPARPNPFVASTQVTFTLAESENVTLAVYDIRGRKVATLIRGIQPAGNHAVAWAGLDDRGRSVEPGVYFTRLEVGGMKHARRVILAR